MQRGTLLSQAMMHLLLNPGKYQQHLCAAVSDRQLPKIHKTLLKTYSSLAAIQLFQSISTVTLAAMMKLMGPCNSSLIKCLCCSTKLAWLGLCVLNSVYCDFQLSWLVLPSKSIWNKGSAIVAFYLDQYWNNLD